METEYALWKKAQTQESKETLVQEEKKTAET